jgi:hypothetical protein
MSYQLTKHQLEALTYLSDWERSSNRFATLTGVAGASKTSTVIHWLSRSRLNLSDVAFVAPTTELVTELRAKLEEAGLPEVSVQTVHSLVGFRPAATDIEEQMLRRFNPEPETIPYRLVILDEAYNTSRIIINDVLSHYPLTKWLLLGDPGQLAPIVGLGESNLPSLADIHSRFVNYHLPVNLRAKCPEQRELTESVRLHGFDCPILQGLITDSHEATMTARTYLRQNYKLPNSFVALAHRHKVVNQLAASMRYAVYKVKDGPYQPGELVRVTGTKDYDGSWLCQNNTVVEVLSHEPDKLIGKKADGTILLLPIDVDNEVAALRDEALAATEKKSRVWAKYHKAKMMYTEIKSPWAKTGYSVQGSTYTRALVNLDDILSAQDKNLLYVAISRSEQLPWVYQD